jgi:hypothetical protein
MRFLLILLMATSFNCNAQNITAELSVNGKKCNAENKCSLSRSEKNVLTIEGEGCDTYVMSGSGLSLSKSMEGWIAKPGKGENVRITISCKKEDGRTVVLATYSLKVVP